MRSEPPSATRVRDYLEKMHNGNEESNDFVRLRRAIDSDMGREIEKVIERRRDGESADDLIRRVTQTEYWRRFQKAYLLSTSGHKSVVERLPVRSQSHPVTDSVTSLNSLLTASSQDTYASLTTEDLQQVCRLLSSSQFAAQLEGLEIIARTSDITCLTEAKEWDTIETFLRSLLYSTSVTVSKETIRFYKHMLTQSDEVSIIAFKSLLKSVKDGLNNSRKVTEHNIRKAAILYKNIIDVQLHISEKWLRTSDAVIKQFVTSSIQFFDCDNIWKLAASVDSVASWIERWLEVRQTREYILLELERRAEPWIKGFTFISKGTPATEDNQRLTIYACCYMMRLLFFERIRICLESAFEQTVDDCLEKLIPQLCAALETTSSDVVQAAAEIAYKSIFGILQTSGNPVSLKLFYSCTALPATYETEKEQRQLYFLSTIMIGLSRNISAVGNIVGKERIVSHALGLTKHICASYGSVHSTFFDKSLVNVVIFTATLLSHPLYFLVEGCKSTVLVVPSVMQLSVPIVREFCAIVSRCNMGCVMWKKGTLHDNYAQRLLLDLNIFEENTLNPNLISRFLPYSSSETQTSVLNLLQQNIWSDNDDDNVDATHKISPLFVIFHNPENVKLLLSKVDAESPFWKTVLLLPLKFHWSEELFLSSLKILKFLVSSLETLLFLTKYFRVQEELRHFMLDYMIDDKEIIVNEMSDLVDSLSMRCALIGGPTERRIGGFGISTMLKLVDDDATSVEHDIITERIRLSESDFADLLLSYKSWRFHFATVVNIKPTKIILDDNFRANSVLMDSDEEFMNGEANVSDNDSNVKLGIEWTLNYGVHLGLLTRQKKQEDTEMMLTLLKKTVSVYGSSCRCDFDFFLATLFLLNGGNGEATLSLHQFLCDRDCYYWYFYNILNVCDDMLCAALCQTYELIVFEELPEVYHALESVGYTSSDILRFWLSQCFWNILDFDTIASVILLATNFGGDYVLYSCGALMKHLMPDIFSWSSQGTLVINIRAEPIKDFRLAKYLPFMHSLRKVYRPILEENFERYKN